MSRTYIDRYFRELENLRRAGATGEGPISQAFGALLKEWGASKNLVFLQQQPVMGTRGREVRPDGVLRYSIRVEFGLWEAKRSGTDIDAEIAAKKRAGYPLRNIIFENAATAVLYQNLEEARRASMDDADALEGLVAQFFAWERPEVRNFNRAVEAFQHDLPAVLSELRNRIDAAYAEKPAYRAEADRFLDHARGTINPNVTPDDVREMLIQHILTEDIFATVFREQQFHRENNVAKELYELEEQLLDRADKHALMKALAPYYGAIRAAAAAIEEHGEKQTFLKVLYEGFYRVYDPKKADRLGVIYTPNEIVRFISPVMKSLFDQFISVVTVMMSTAAVPSIGANVMSVKPTSV